MWYDNTYDTNRRFSMIFEKVKEIIVNQLEIEPEKVTLESYFIDDLDADSLDVMELIMQFESVFEIEVDEETLSEVKQVKDVVAYFEKMQNKN